jgi:hypothetical protein
MIEEYENQRQKQLSQMRTITNYGMGVVFLCVGIFFFIYKSLGINLSSKTDDSGRGPDTLDIIIGILFVTYGAWRIYRGYKKNYFK